METDLLPFEMLMCLELLSCSRFTFFVVVVVVIARFFFFVYFIVYFMNMCSLDSEHSFM